VSRLLPATGSCTHLVQKNQFPELKPEHFDFFTLNLTVWSHILSTSGDALSHLLIQLLANMDISK
jgi:hypothetical protein